MPQMKCKIHQNIYPTRENSGKFIGQYNCAMKTKNFISKRLKWSPETIKINGANLKSQTSRNFILQTMNALYFLLISVFSLCQSHRSIILNKSIILVRDSLSRIIAFIVFFLMSLSLFAGSLSLREIKQVAANFFYEHKVIGDKEYSVSTPDELIASCISYRKDTTTLLYVLSLANHKGFVIISNEDQTIPILGYSLYENFDIQNLPPALEWLLGNYQVQIETIKQKKLKSSSLKGKKLWTKYKADKSDFISNSIADISETSSGVSALLSTEWDQVSGWNQYCPVDSKGPGGHAYAGCTAVSMAQIMNYWKFPDHGTGSHSYYHAVYGTLSVNFSNQTYNWSLMSGSTYDKYNALLIYHCGVSADMNYGPDQSGAYNSVALNSLKEYFGYKKSAQYISRDQYSSDGWISLLRNELTEERPILYEGHGVGDHSFVVDGVDGGDLFHINWGWSGSYDSYYSLDDLTPGGYNFNNSQMAGIGIEPDINNDECINAITLTSNVSCSLKAGDIANATKSIAAISCNKYSSTMVQDVWFKFTATSTTHTISVYPSGGLDAVVDLRTGSCNGTTISCSDNGGGDGGAEILTASGLNAGSTYYIRVYDYTGSSTPPTTTTFDICVTGTASNSDDFYIENASVSPSSVAGGETIDVSCDQCYSGSATDDSMGSSYVGYYLSSNTSFSSSADTRLETDASGLGSDDPCNTEKETLTIPAGTIAGTHYILFVADYDDRFSEINENNNVTYKKITVTAACISPAITSQPSNHSVTAPAGLSFSIAATGSDNRYQWQYNDGSGWVNVPDISPYSGVTSTTLIIGSTSTWLNGYQYRCCVTSTCTSTTATSSAVTLTVSQACASPVITSQPSNHSVTAPAGVSFSIVATGSNNRYQWQYNKGSGWVNVPDMSPYSGVTSTNLFIGSTSTGLNGYQYRCYVTSTCTSTTATSSAVTLTVMSECIAPMTPQFLSVTIGNPANGLEHKLEINCENVAGAEGYSYDYSWNGIYWENGWYPNGPAKFSANLHDQPNKSIYFRARAYGCSPQKFSNYIYDNKQPVYTACDDPIAPSINDATSTSLNLTLVSEIPVANPNYTLYSIYCTNTFQYVQTDGTLDNNEVFQTRNGWGTIKIVGLQSSKEYCFYAKAKNNNGDVRFNPLNTACGTTTSDDSFFAKEATNITQNSFSANWTKSASALGYYLDVSTNSFFTTFLYDYNNKNVGNTTTFQVTGLEPNTSFWYRVVPYNIYGGVGTFSNTIKVTTSLLTISDEESANKIVVFPNPACYILKVTNIQDSKLDIIDLMGRNVLTLDCRSVSVEIDIRKLVLGTYTLRITKDNEISFRKFVIFR